ncbi:type II toxin-antitoxin system HicA family toxin [Endothiovibrio diazotrophicus]
MNSREILRQLKAHGWYEVAKRGSHLQLKHDERPGRVTVPHPKREIHIDTLKNIERQSGVKLR